MCSCACALCALECLVLSFLYADLVVHFLSQNCVIYMLQLCWRGFGCACAVECPYRVHAVSLVRTMCIAQLSDRYCLCVVVLGRFCLCTCGWVFGIMSGWIVTIRFCTVLSACGSIGANLSLRVRLSVWYCVICGWVGADLSVHLQFTFWYCVIYLHQCMQLR